MSELNDVSGSAMTPPIVFAGHSHMVALAGDGFQSPPALRQIEGEHHAFVLDASWPRDQVYWDALKGFAKNADVAVMWGGNEHNVSYFFEAAYQFDLLSSHVPLMTIGAQIIPKSRIQKRFRGAGIGDLEKVLHDLKRSGAHSVFLLGTPPPKKDNEALRAMLQTEPYFIEWAKQIGESLETIKITKPHVRLKLWFVLQDMLSDFARDARVKFIPIPSETQDAEGFLLPEFWNHDVTHANHAYGHIMRRKVIDQISTGISPSS